MTPTGPRSCRCGPLVATVPSARPPAGLPAWGGRYAQQWTAATLATYGTTCHLCRQPGADSADHLTPRSKGGTDTLANLRPAHHGCNSLRGDLDLPSWFAAHPVPRAEPLPPSRDW
jgi:5-methylcytosine-specific restriction endonuclease McrA